MKNPREYGSPPYSIAVIHGGPGACGEMKPVAENLSKDLGILEPLQTSSSLQGQVDELKKILSRSGTSPFILVGFSWGAWLSLLTTAYYPSLIKKIILIGSGPFKEKYVEKISKTRLSRLNKKEKIDFKSTIKKLNDPRSENNSYLIQKLEDYMNTTDQYNPRKDNEKENNSFNQEIFRKVWKEAETLRISGKLIDTISSIKCPVVAIHGDYDPHPAEGVKKPLARILNDFRFIKLERCGHKPWIEKEAKDNFYRILRKELYSI